MANSSVAYNLEQERNDENFTSSTMKALGGLAYSAYGYGYGDSYGEINLSDDEVKRITKGEIISTKFEGF